ncbi:MAG: phospholipase D family protein [Alphaproteobacteria bacterium]|nr:MAG: phospholipase D family protein [Alphaproteobacteria bacterium]
MAQTLKPQSLFLTRPHLDEAIKTLLKEPQIRCAVAFWGFGAEKMFEATQEARIICNLKSGGTNPAVIDVLRKRKGLDVKQCDTLHAKVYIGKDRAVVASANASANGLGLEGSEQAKWVEAGVLLDPVDKIVTEWFKKEWEEAREITDKDIREAKENWKKHKRGKPSVSFADFRWESFDDMPLVTWYGNSDWEADKKAIKRAVGVYDEWSVENSIEVEGKEDERHLSIGRWVLTWERTKSARGLPKLTWVFLGDLVRDGFVYKGESKARSMVLADKNRPSDPFNPNEKRFREAFRDVLNYYEDLRTDDYKGAWFNPRIKTIEHFWEDLKKRY